MSKKIVVIGGGTGTFTVLTGLKQFAGLDISAIVAMSDDGGSTGRLRTELGVLPPGDVRQALVALSESDKLMLDLMKYRFEEGSLKGHNFGNLFLTALSKIKGNFSKAVKAASEVLNVQGKVIPVTTEQSELIVKLANGKIVRGETRIDDEPPIDQIDQVVTEIYLEPKVSANVDAIEAINDADMIVVGPGDFYGSVMANIVVDGIGEAINNSKAKKVFVMNLMTRFGQRGFTTSKYLEFIEKYIKIDVVLINNQKAPDEIIKMYEQDNEYPIMDDFNGIKEPRVEKADLLGTVNQSLRSGIRQAEVDVIKRSLIRHSPQKLATKLIEILNY